MTTPALQKSRATVKKRRAQVRFQRNLTPWIKKIINDYSIGDRIGTRDATIILQIALRDGYTAGARDTLTFDINEFKQLGDDDITVAIFKAIATQLNVMFVNRETRVARSVTSTSDKHVSRITELAIANEWTERQAKATLANTLKSQRLIIAVSESQYTIETTRNIAVLTVKDPLNNSVEQVARLIQNGDTNGAVRLARKVNKLARLPVSVSEGDLIRTIYGAAQNARVVNPLAQGRVIANLREQAEELGQKGGKQWETLGDGKVRPSHEAVNGAIVENVDEPFLLEGGALQYPGDASLGAGPEETINCRCVMIYL